MLFKHTLFIGIDPTASQREITYAALDRDLRLHALDEGDIEEITAFVAGQESAFVAICGPQRPNQSLMKDKQIRQNLNPAPRPGRWTRFRVAEYQLYQHKIRTPGTPEQRDSCPGWMQTSFAIFQRLKKMGYHPYPESDSPGQVLEVYPHGAFTALLERIPFKKDTLEGRLQRQLVLHNRGLEIPDPMRIFDQITRYRLLQGILPLEGLYNLDELDSLVAGYTAWKAALHPEEITTLGDTDEGEIVLPVEKLKPIYT
jgi:hypothetical protein